uniref:Tetratricopeptide repeat protein 5 OB fold domain-containing protein n=1 Tax=Panagrolaimus sp. JU765 TaxID=591449 RepID=A0AC34QVI0_9BILA
MTVKPSEIVEYPCLNEKIKGKDSSLAEFRQKVRQFENQTWRFMHDHPGADNSDRVKAVTASGNALLNVLPLSASKAQKSYWMARIYFTMDADHPRALELAEKALRLNAFMVDAYILMANINWAQKQFKKASVCIPESYNLEQSPKTMAYMSFSYRIASTQAWEPTHKDLLIKQAIELAKGALKLDPNYVFAQYCLGISYFYKFFLPGKKNEYILKCGIAICEKAVNHPTNPFIRSDVFFNLAEAEIYLQNYNKAIDYLQKARQWEGIKDELPALATLYSDLKKLYFEFDKQKALMSIHKAMNADELTQNSNCGICSLSNHSATSIAVKVISQIPTERSTPKNFVVLDSNFDVAVLSIFNVSESIKIFIKDVLYLPAPTLKMISIPYLGDLTILRVEDPVGMTRNGKGFSPRSSAKPRNQKKKTRRTRRQRHKRQI